MVRDLQNLADLLYLASIYSRRNHSDIAIKLLQDFLKRNGKSVCDGSQKKILAIALFNLAELCIKEGDRLIAKKLHMKAVDIWKEIDPGNPFDILRYHEAIRQLRDESHDLVLLGAHRVRKERRETA